MMINVYMADGWTRSQLLEERATFLSELDLIEEALAKLPEEPECDHNICSVCSGSGEGMYDGSRCYSCKGSGVERREED